jgi:TetR/AcrR family transcriptional regulator, cholesterol catabolism regulator
MKVHTDNKPSANIDARTGEIYQCAAELIVEKGFGHATIADIARKMKMTKAGLYYYISSKQDMLYRIMKYAMDVVESGIIQPTQAIVDPEQRLREIIRCHARELIKRGLTISVLLAELNHLEPAQREKIMARKQAYVMFVQETIQQVQAQGKLCELRVDLATQHLLSTLRGIAVWYPLATDVGIEEAVENTTAYILGGLLK